MSSSIGLWILSLVLSQVATPDTAGRPPTLPTLDAETFDRWLRYVRPTPEELAYSKIDWRPELWPALREANDLDKPLLIWVMNGHPLGCT